MIFDDISMKNDTQLTHNWLSNLRLKWFKTSAHICENNPLERTKYIYSFPLHNACEKSIKFKIEFPIIQLNQHICIQFNMMFHWKIIKSESRVENSFLNSKPWNSLAIYAKEFFGKLKNIYICILNNVYKK
jgi:hypothetical protein